MLQSKSTWLVVLAGLAVVLASLVIYKHLENNKLKAFLHEMEDVKPKSESPEADMDASENPAVSENLRADTLEISNNDEKPQKADEETVARLNREVASLKNQLAQSQNLYSGGDKKLASRLDSMAAANTELKDSLYFLNEQYQKLRLNRNLYTLTNAKGDKIYYFGDMKGDRADGYGVAIWPSGEVYKGEWKQNKRHGKGILTWESGEKYVGDFADDVRHGYGILNKADGTRYEGEWKNDMEHGTGTLYDRGNKALKQGTWQNGKFGG